VQPKKYIKKPNFLKKLPLWYSILLGILCFSGCALQYPTEYATFLKSTVVQYRLKRFSDLPNWPGQLTEPTLKVFLKSCQVLHMQPNWRAVCIKAKKLAPNSSALQEFFESEFTPWQLLTPTTHQGLITSYYEPLLKGYHSFNAQAAPYPIYGIPRNIWLISYPKSLHKASILIFRFSANQKMVIVPNKKAPGKNEWILYPQKFWHDNRTVLLSARIIGNELVPYYTRREIHEGQGIADMPVLGWVESWVDLAYLQIQGSGRIQFENGQVVRLNYAAQNGHPFVSLAKWLMQYKKLSVAQVSKAGIKDWLQKHPADFPKLLAVNPNYIFFQETAIPATEGPIGALGVSITEKLSVAIDARYIPLGAPVYIATKHPLTHKPLNRLVFAQDKGSEIKGPLRIDWFWGFGEQAGTEAEKMHQLGNIWLLLPNKVRPFTAEF